VVGCDEALVMEDLLTVGEVGFELIPVGCYEGCLIDVAAHSVTPCYAFTLSCLLLRTYSSNTHCPP
jgi:hypothetical protein